MSVSENCQVTIEAIRALSTHSVLVASDEASLFIDALLHRTTQKSATYVKNFQVHVTNTCTFRTNLEQMKESVTCPERHGNTLHLIVMGQMKALLGIASTDPTMSAILSIAASTSPSNGVEDQFVTNAVFQAPDAPEIESGSARVLPGVALGSPEKQVAPPSSGGPPMSLVLNLQASEVGSDGGESTIEDMRSAYVINHFTMTDFKVIGTAVCSVVCGKKPGSLQANLCCLAPESVTSHTAALQFFTQYQAAAMRLDQRLTPGILRLQTEVFASSFCTWALLRVCQTWQLSAQD